MLDSVQFASGSFVCTIQPVAIAKTSHLSSSRSGQCSPTEIPHAVNCGTISSKISQIRIDAFHNSGACEGMHHMTQHACTVQPNGWPFENCFSCLVDLGTAQPLDIAWLILQTTQFCHHQGLMDSGRHIPGNHLSRSLSLSRLVIFYYLMVSTVHAISTST